jgi:hypothetical protein
VSGAFGYEQLLLFGLFLPGIFVAVTSLLLQTPQFNYHVIS